MIQIKLEKLRNGIQSPNQHMDQLEQDEILVITIEKIPFIKLIVTPTMQHKYCLSSKPPISMRTYEISDENDDWGDFDEIGECVNKAVSIVAGFINWMGKEMTNNGNYYQD